MSYPYMKALDGSGQPTGELEWPSVSLSEQLRDARTAANMWAARAIHQAELVKRWMVIAFCLFLAGVVLGLSLKG